MPYRNYEPADLARANFKIHQLEALEKDNIENAFAGTVQEVLGRINEGKEATVYLCLGTSGQFLAAKVFKARHFRHFNTDRRYRDLGKQKDARMARAMKKRSARGETAFHKHWIDSEWRMLNRLFDAGVRVPAPVAKSDDGVLMSFIGDEHGAAPRLKDVELSQPQWQRCADNLTSEIQAMLNVDVVHGDLSAYNVLYFQGQPVVIDVPQAMDLQVESQAFSIMQRDLGHLEDFFRRKDVDVRLLELLVFR